MKRKFTLRKTLCSGIRLLKLSVIAVALFLAASVSRGQNLIDNASFEDMLACPGGTFSGIPNPSQGPLFLTNWYAPNGGTSDYYNVCSTDTLFQVPNNLFGSQMPRTGSGYVGIILSAIGNEYVESELNTQMINGHHYFCNYWTVVADRSPGASDQFGAYFSSNVIDLPTNTLLNQYTPQVVSTIGVPYSDTANWQKVSGTFIANGGEKFITIGVFKDWGGLNILPFVEDGGFGIGELYYYIDDVCVVDMDGTPSDVAIHNATLCPDPSIKLDARQGMESYVWSDSSTANSMEVTQPGTYWVKSVQLSTCSVIVDTFKVEAQLSKANINIGEDKTLCNNKPETLEIKEDGFKRYLWSTGDTTSSIVVKTPGNYFVTAYNNCLIASDTVQVKAGENCNLCLFVPNAFSPNNDGLNDIMAVNALCPISFFELNIYNRFGERVFASTNPKAGWNGEYKGKTSDAGTYFYYIQYQNTNDESNTVKIIKGDLALLR